MVWQGKRRTNSVAFYIGVIMAGYKTIYEDNGLKAIIGIPGWAEDFNDRSGKQTANTTVGAWASVPLL